MTELFKKPIGSKDKARKCDHCDYELSNEGVMFYYLSSKEKGIWCSFDCAIHADNPGTSDEFDKYDKG